MNQLIAKVIHIEHVNNLYQLKFMLKTEVIHMVSLEIQHHLKVGDEVKLSVKSTNISLAKNSVGLLSFSNQLKGKIQNVNNGKLLSSILIDVEGFTLESLISLDGSLKMALKKDDKVVVLIEGSNISLC